MYLDSAIFDSKNLYLRTYHSKLDRFTSTATTFDNPHIQHVVFGWIWNQTKSFFSLHLCTLSRSWNFKVVPRLHYRTFSFRFVTQRNRLSKYSQSYQIFRNGTAPTILLDVSQKLAYVSKVTKTIPIGCYFVRFVTLENALANHSAIPAFAVR